MFKYLLALLLAAPAAAQISGGVPAPSTGTSGGGETGSYAGAKTFGSSVTVAGTLTLQGSAASADPVFGWNIPGQWVMIASMTTSVIGQQTSWTFSGLSSSTTYRLDIHTTKRAGGGRPYLRFNGDTGANYLFGGQTFAWNGSSPFGANSFGTSISLTFDNIDNNKVFDAVTYFGTVYGYPTTVYARTDAIDWRGGNYYLTRDNSFGQYDGGANLSSITFGHTTFNFEGELRLYKLNN